MARRLSTPVPTQFADDRTKAHAFQQLLLGKLRCVGDVTLHAGQTSTTVGDPLFGKDTILLLRPTTSAGAALKTWQASATKGQVVLGHDPPGADAPFLYAALG